MSGKRDIAKLLNGPYADNVLLVFSYAFENRENALKALSYLISEGHDDQMIYRVAHGYKTRYVVKSTDTAQHNRFKTKRRAKIRRQQINQLLKGVKYPKYAYLDIGCETMMEPENYADTLGISRTAMNCINIRDWAGAYEENVHGNAVGNDSRFSFYDGVNIPHDDSSFSVVTLNMVLHHVSDHMKDELLKNVYRVLEEGGILIIREHDSHHNDSDKKEEFDLYLDFIHHHYDSVANRDFRWVDDYETTYESQTALRKRLEDHGFRSVRSISYNRNDRAYQEVFKIDKKRGDRG